MRPRCAVAAVLLALTTLTGCHAGAGPPPRRDAETVKASTGSASPTSETPSPMLTPTAPASSALGAGQRIWAAFSERGLPYAAWWAQLKPFLSTAARAEYVYDDPRNLPVMQLTGHVSVAPRPPARPGYTAAIIVPTSKGTFRLDLERRTRSAPWVLYGMVFPSTVQ
jgi:hypothetical protein